MAWNLEALTSMQTTKQVSCILILGCGYVYVLNKKSTVPLVCQLLHPWTTCIPIPNFATSRSKSERPRNGVYHRFP